MALQAAHSNHLQDAQGELLVSSKAQFQHVQCAKTIRGRVVAAALSVLVLACTLLGSSRAWAEVPLSSILENRFGRYLLLKTAEGERLLGRVMGERIAAGGVLSRKELLSLAQARLSLPEFLGERTAIEARLQSLLEQFEQEMAGLKRSLGNGGKRLPKRGERKFLDEIAAREMQVNPKWSAERTGTEFFEPRNVEGVNFKNAREAFTQELPSAPLAPDTSLVPVSERPLASRRVKGFIEKMNSCVAGAPADTLHSETTSYMLTQLGFDEVFMTGGAIVSAAMSGDVDWKSLPNDLIFAGLTSLGDSYMASRPGRFSLRWFRLIAISPIEAGGAVGGKAIEDVIVYHFFRSDSETSSHAENELSQQGKFAYNTAWGAAYAPVTIGMYKLVTGLKCIGASRGLVFGIRAGVGVTAATTYYTIRNGVVAATQ